MMTSGEDALRQLGAQTPPTGRPTVASAVRPPGGPPSPANALKIAGVPASAVEPPADNWPGAYSPPPAVASAETTPYQSPKENWERPYTPPSAVDGTTPILAARQPDASPTTTGTIKAAPDIRQMIASAKAAGSTSTTANGTIPILPARRPSASPSTMPAATTAARDVHLTTTSAKPDSNAASASTHRGIIAAARAVGSLQPAEDNLPQTTRDDIGVNREPVPAPESIPPPPDGIYPIDLPTALRLADRVNPTINRTRSEVLEALAERLAARVILVPSLNGGLTYHGHNGPLQRSAGRILSLSQQSLYLGGGAAGTVTAETVGIPAVNIAAQLTDAIYLPLVTHQRVVASRFNVRATENSILLEVALLQLELMRHYTLLETHRLSEVQAFEIVGAIQQYAITGQGRLANYDRARAEWRYRRADVIDAQQGIGIAAARLAQRLNLDPSVSLQPAGGPLIPIDLVALDTPPEELIQVALRQRPDIASRSAQVGAREFQVKQEIGRPLLPSLWLGFSGGAYGGGSNLVPPLLGNFRGRTDFDLRLYWTFMGGGMGNLALIRERQAEVGAAVAARARTINTAREQVMSALADANAARHQIDIAIREVQAARSGFHEDLERSRQNLGRPIEVVNFLGLLAKARAHLVDAIVRYDQSQFRLWVALGTPPPLVESSGPVTPEIPEYLIP